MKIFFAILLALCSLPAIYAQQTQPNLPNFVDPNELICGYGSYPSCYAGSPGIGYTAPTLLLTLSAGGGTWNFYPGGGSTSAPSCATASYTNNGAGLQNAWNTQESCRKVGVGIRLVLPVLSTDSGTGCDVNAYCLGNGFVVPQTASGYSSIPLVVVSAADSSLAAMNPSGCPSGQVPPIGTGGVQENVPTSTCIRIDNPTNDGQNLSYQLGSTVYQITLNGACVAAGGCSPYVLANGISFANLAALISAYNYKQYMPHLECSATDCTPLSLCSPSSSSCGNPALGPDHWELDDLNVSLPAGSTSNSFIINGGSATKATFVSPTSTQFGEHNHIRRPWVHGDWYCSDLSCGANKVASGITMNAQYYFSVGDGYISGALSPGNEAHCGGVDGTLGYVFNFVCSGESSGWFSGGFGSTPATPTYLPATDIQMGPPWVVKTVPRGWLGMNCTNYQDGKGNNGGPACGNVPNKNYPWGGAGDNYPESVPTAVTGLSTSGSGASFSLSITSALNPGVSNNIVSLIAFSPSEYNQTWPVTTSGPGNFTVVPAQSITNASISGATMTVTSGLTPGSNAVYLAGLTPSACNGAYTAANSKATSFTVPVTGSCSGTVTVAASAKAYLAAAPSIGSGSKAQLAGPVCPYVTGSNIVCVDVSTTGTSVTIHGGSYPAGMPVFHDSGSTWGVAHKPVHINNDTSNYTIASIGSGTCNTSGSYPWSGCPTSMTLQAAVPECVGTGCSNIPFYFNGPSIVIKNCQENKSSNRMLFMLRGQNVDNSGAQNGVCPEIDTRNVSGGATGANYYSSNSNDTYLGSVFDGGCTGDENDARSAPSGGDGGGTSQSSRWQQYLNILFFNNTATNPGCNTDSFGSFIDTANETWKGNIVASGGVSVFTANFSVDAGAPLEADAFTTFTASGTSVTVPASNTFVGGETVSFFGTGTCMDNNPGTVGSGVTSTSVPLTGLNPCGSAGSPVTIPGGTGTIQGPVGFQTFGMQIGDPIYITGCNNSANNMPSAAGYTNIAVKTGTGYAPYATAGLTPFNYSTGWVTSNTQVTFPWAGGVTENDGAASVCTLINATGNPQMLTRRHITVISDANNPVGGGPAKSKGASIQLLNNYTDSIYLTGQGVAANDGGWWNSSVNAPEEGLSTEIFNYDQATFSACHNIFPNRTNTLYYWFNANPGTNACTGLAGVPATTDFPSTTCGVGFQGTGLWQYPCTGNLVPQSAPNFAGLDYHGFVLNPGSPFHNTASDGLDHGAIITGTSFNGTSIDAGSVATQFQCAWVGQTCAGPGPFPTVPGGGPPPVQAPFAPTATIFAAVEKQPRDEGLRK